MKKKKQGNRSGTEQPTDDLKMDSADDAEVALEKAEKFIQALDIEITGKQLKKLLKNNP